jgi:hypothetical protein
MKPLHRCAARALSVMVFAGSPMVLRAQEQNQDQKTDGPETVPAAFPVKADQLQAFLAMMPEYWKVLRAKNLVNPEPYVLMEGDEGGKPLVYEIFSWKDHHGADPCSGLRFRRIGTG